MCMNVGTYVMQTSGDDEAAESYGNMLTPGGTIARLMARDRFLVGLQIRAGA